MCRFDTTAAVYLLLFYGSLMAMGVITHTRVAIAMKPQAEPANLAMRVTDHMWREIPSISKGFGIAFDERAISMWTVKDIVELHKEVKGPKERRYGQATRCQEVLGVVEHALIVDTIYVQGRAVGMRLTSCPKA